MVKLGNSNAQDFHHAIGDFARATSERSSGWLQWNKLWVGLLMKSLHSVDHVCSAPFDLVRHTCKNRTTKRSAQDLLSGAGVGRGRSPVAELDSWIGQASRGLWRLGGLLDLSYTPRWMDRTLHLELFHPEDRE